MGAFKVLLIVAMACIPAFFPAFLQGQGNVAVDKSSDGEGVVLRVGQHLEVRLEQTGSTGYTWQVVDLDEKLLECVESATAPARAGKIVGAPVMRTWRFQAVGKGRTELKMLKYRSWEGPESAVDTFTVRVKVM